MNKLEIARLQILNERICNKLPVFYKYVICNHFNYSSYIIPFDSCKYYNTDYYSVIPLYKPIANIVVTFNKDER